MTRQLRLKTLATCSNILVGNLFGLSMINSTIRYFDLFSGYRDPSAVAQGVTPTKVAWWRQLFIYLVCAVGVLVSPYIPSALAGPAPSLASVFNEPNRIGWSLIIALAVLPGVYKLIFNPKSPFVVQCGFALVAGFASQKIVPAVIALILKS
jgi:hypothetical protein